MTAPSSAGCGLVGYTGFVGSNLRRQGSFEHLYNSQNFLHMRDKHFDLLVCAGVSAAKWIANRDPEEDRRRIAELTALLATTNVAEFVLISTIDVYPKPALGGDEVTLIDCRLCTPYGRHRYELEEWVQAHFPNCRIIRLPALFGPGLKKNALFDMLHDNQVDAINPASVFQWYPVDRLWSDITIARQAELRLANLFPEPLVMSRIIEACFPAAKVGPPHLPAPAYRVSTIHAELFSGSNGFIMSAGACLAAIAAYVAAEKAVL
jgi:hypothetical protein